MPEKEKISKNVQLVKMGFTLTQKVDQKTLLEHIKEELENLDISSQRLDPDFIRWIAEKIENHCVTEKDEKPDKPNKQEMFSSIMKALFPNLSNTELEQANQIVKHLLKHKLVKKTKVTKVMAFYLKKKFGIIA